MKRISFRGFNLFLTLCAITALFLSSPLLSKSGIAIPDISSLKPYSSGTHFMSLEGYVISYVRVNYGKEISPAEARKIIRAAAQKMEDKKTAVKTPEINEKDFSCQQISAHMKSLSQKCAELLKIFQTLAISRPARRAAAECSLEKFTSKRILLVASKTEKDGTEASEIVRYFIKKKFLSMGYEILESPSAINENPLEQKKDAIKQAKTLGADLIINYDIKKYKRGKKICIPGMLIDVAFLGIWNKAEINVNAKVYSVKKKTYIHNGSAKAEKKRKVLSLFCGSRGLMAYAANSAVNKLFEDFKN
ncbi:MAG TPA: hypothetical protein PKK26_06095 [Candidatus Wallbacteria bacterium]|nr:hypothetical protein [Candidatus Wallbacteria bacterium]